MNQATAQKPDRSTRSQSKNCPIFGNADYFKENYLPSYSDVMKCFLQLQQNEYAESKKHPSTKEIASVLCEHIETIWSRASIPVISRQGSMKKFLGYYDKYNNIMRSYKKRKNIQSFSESIGTFRKDADTTLFDISACKCNDFGQCICPKPKKVPLVERTFLLDQRTTRKMIIGGIDQQISKKIQIKNQRAAAFTEHKQEPMPGTSFERKNSSDLSELLSDMSVSDEEYSPRNARQKQDNKVRVSLPSVAQMADRYAVSNRAAAAIASATLQDVGMVSNDDKELIIDKNKIRRARQNVRHKLLEETVFPPSAIFFDGRKDPTKIQTLKDGIAYQSIFREEHITVLEEPGSEYLGHYATPSGGAKVISNAMLHFLEKRNIRLMNVIAVGCDGTVTNTGQSNGIIRLIEERLKTPLHWLICLLHINELPLRHLFNHIDGTTKGPSTFSGPIGKKLENCMEKKPVQFVIIETDNMPEDIMFDDLSRDQKYLYSIWKAVSTGEIPSHLVHKQPGPLYHARWLTLASRILRLYVTEEEPTQGLTDLATFIVKVYAPCWFIIKKNPYFYDGSRNFYNMIAFSKYLRPELKEKILPVLQRNAFYIHPENLLASMLTDPRQVIRRVAAKRIKTVRQQQTEITELRKFKIPSLNFDANHYTEMIDWHSCEKHEPPITMELTNDEINILCSEDNCIMTNHFKKLPCHTQAVERCIKLVTEASNTIYNKEERDGYVLAKLKSRKEMAFFESKKDYSF